MRTRAARTCSEPLARFPSFRRPRLFFYFYFIAFAAGAARLRCHRGGAARRAPHGSGLPAPRGASPAEPPPRVPSVPAVSPLPSPSRGAVTPLLAPSPFRSLPKFPTPQGRCRRLWPAAGPLPFLPHFPPPGSGLCNAVAGIPGDVPPPAPSVRPPGRGDAAAGAGAAGPVGGRGVGGGGSGGRGGRQRAP